MHLVPSRYNFAIQESECVLLYNAASGAVLKLEGPHAGLIAGIMENPDTFISGQEFEPELERRLRKGQFLIPHDFDELQLIRERYWRARAGTPVVLTITTTMDCNLGCYYCYEQRSSHSLNTSDIGAVVDLARHLVEQSGKRGIHVDWYGGEPLLNFDFLESASLAIQAYCKEAGHYYVASVISNGTEWPDDVRGFVERHRLRQVQISFDGLQTNHDKRRRYRSAAGGRSSFQRAVNLVDKLADCVRVDVRFNADRGNQADLVPFIRFVRERGWFQKDFPVVLQPARLASYSARSSFMRPHELTLEEFDALRAAARQEMGAEASVQESEVPDGFPYPKTSVCAALADHSMVIGAEGSLYRCGLQVGESSRSVGRLGAADEEQQQTVDSGWWAAFDPTQLPTCSKCSFLPICWGGCPKKHLEGDQHAIREQGRYWRTNLPRLIAKSAKIDHVVWPEISEERQFR